MFEKSLEEVYRIMNYIFHDFENNQSDSNTTLDDMR